MRIMHVIESLEHGGAEAVVADLANACADDHEVTVCCLKRRGKLGARLGPDISVVCLHKGEGNDLSTVWRLAREARRRRIDVLHSHSWGVFLETVLASWLSRVAVVHTAHGPYLQHTDDLRGRLKAKFRRALERIASRRVEVIACVSASIRDFVNEQMRLPTAVTVVHNGIPDRRPAPPRAHNGTRRLISVGRLAPIKNYDALLRAFAELTRRMPRSRLTLVGDGPERQHLERLAERLCIASSVEFKGFSDDVPGLLAAHDMFVLSSRHEGISVAILEAMRAGLPVVATRVGGVPETVIDGVTGRLVETDDPAAMADVMAEMLGCTANLQAMGAAGRAVQQRRFSLSRMSERYTDLYETAAGRPSDDHEVVSDRPLKVLYHHRTQGRGAEGVHIASIVRSLEQMGHEVTVLGPPGVDVLATAGAAPVDKSDVATRGRATVWKLISRWAPAPLFEFAEIAYNVVAWWRLRSALRSQAFDVIYERYAFYLIAGARLAARHRIPFVLEANEVNGLEERARAQAMPRLSARFEAHLFARCTSILTVSSYLRRRIVTRGVHPRRVRVVPNAIEPSFAAPVAGVAELRQRYGVEDRRVVGFAGWFDHWDRLDLLLEAMAELRHEFPDATAMLVGDGPAAAALYARVEALGLADNVVFTGPVPREEMRAYQALFDIAVLPHSNRFGSPVVLFEFMASGVPVVAPRLDPITDVLRDGVTGRIFEPLNAPEMTAGIGELLRSAAVRQRIGNTARDRVLDEHTWDRNAAQILHAAELIDFDAMEPRRIRLAS
jgi:glycosyltransferase involved in cell wall biosynthesis